MTTAGWIFMGSCWGLVIYLTFYCFHRTLKIEDEKKKLPK